MPRLVALALCFAAIFALALLPAAEGVAQAYPSRQIRLVIGQAPGGHNDVIGRIVGPQLGEILKQPVVPENRGGAGGTIGAELVARAPGDGYTLLLGGSNNLAIAATLVEGLRYDATLDFSPIGGVAIVPYAVAVGARVPAATIAELVAYARAHPGRLTYGSGGVGSTSSLAVEWLKAAAGISIVHVPYRGSAPAVLALLSGEVDVVVTDAALLTPHAKAGTLRLLGAAGRQRIAALPDLPTVAEQGISGYAIEGWYGLVAPAGTPSEVVAKLGSALRQSLRSPEVRRRFEELGYETMATTPAEFGALIRSDTDRYAAVIRRAGIRVER